MRGLAFALRIFRSIRMDCTAGVARVAGGLCLASLVNVVSVVSAVSVASPFVGPASASGTEAGNTATFDYLYIEANEGGSSGGHAAIRFGPHVYHFQNHEKLLVLNRERADEFLFSYALLNNRTIHGSQIGVEAEVATGLAERFLRRYRAQEAQLATRDALTHDRLLLESGDDPIVLVPGYGYFEQAGTVGSEESEALRGLREKIVARYGADFQVERRRMLVETLARLAQEDPAGWRLVLPRTVYDHPAFAQSWSGRIADLAAGLAALDVLEGARPLDMAAVKAPRSEVFRFGEEERVALARFAHRIERDLVDLVGSQREDWGPTFLVGMARLAALEASLARGQFVFLDTFPARHGTIDTGTLRRREEIVPFMMDETRLQLSAARRYFTHATDSGELAWERVEERLVRHHELLRAVAGESDLRLARGHLVPTHAAPYRLPALQPRAGVPRATDLARVRARERDYADRVEELHRYDLIVQNCVTAIMDTLKDEFSALQAGSRRSFEALGDLEELVESQGVLAFIPFVSARQVNAQDRVLDRYTFLSYRRLRLREMREQESPLWLALRESNTITARTYQRGERDSFFVFFTEDSVLLRPLFGVINLVASLGESVWGLARLPFDRGRTLVSGLKGTFVSLPELAFANIRKGSNDWVAPEFRRLEPRRVGQSHHRLEKPRQ